MSTATLSGTALVAAQKQFKSALPTMYNVIRHHFRNWPARRRAEALADARAALWAAWHSLVRRGKDPLQVGVTGIAGRCCMYTKAGRKIGNTNTGRGCLDVFDRRAWRRLGFQIVSLDWDDEMTTGAPEVTWREWLAENNRVTPADEAAFRVDFGRWLAGLPERKRKMAELLLQGHETGAVSRMLDVTPSAVSQSRTWLQSSWSAFQGEVTSGEVEPGCRPVGRPRKADHAAPRRPRSRTVAHVLEQVS